MAKAIARVSVKPDIMKWARETAGLSWDEVAKVLNVSTSTVEDWEMGTRNPTLNTLKKLSSYYRRPLAVFFLPEPPREPPLPDDFRFLPKDKRKPISKKSLLAIRKARYVQSVATELAEINERTRGALPRRALRDDPETVALTERERLGITIGDQFEFRDLYEAFRKWREAIENLNIIVYQVRISPQEIRGFSLTDGMLPVIVVSLSDSVSAKIFTMFHEYAHIMLGKSGICIPQEASSNDEDTMEKYCDHFAGAFLVPKHDLMATLKSLGIKDQQSFDLQGLGRLSNRFKVSRYVILRRLLIAEFITKQNYLNILHEITIAERPRKKGTPKMAASRKCLVENGKLFITLALEAVAKDAITYSDVADYLSLNLKNLDKVEALV